MESIAVGALEDKQVGSFGWDGWIEDGGAARADVAAERDPLVFVADFDSCGAEDMSCGREAEFGICAESVPFTVGNGLEQFADRLEDICDHLFVSGDAESNGIFEHDG